MVLTSVLLATALLQQQKPVFNQPQHAHYSIPVGWHDELERSSNWGPLNMENKAQVIAPPGTLLLTLGHVPANWPYTYQWSGVTQDANVDLATYPVLMAKANYVFGYAHMDIDVLDGRGQVEQTLRSSTLNAPGLSSVDLGASLKPGQYHLRLRLIVGGQNEGCAAIYDWVRFVKRSDVDFLTNNPDWPYVRMDGGMDEGWR